MFWDLWWVGVAITIVTRILSNKIFKNKSCFDQDDIYTKSKPVQIIMHILVIICIFLVGGIPNGKFLGIFNFSIGGSILLAILPAILTYGVGWFVLRLNFFQNIVTQILFLVIFIISIITWTILCVEYNNNIERTTESNIIISVEERELTYFYGIPVQNISGSVSGSSILGYGSVGGSISTTDYIPYWYVNGEERLSDKAPTSESKMLLCEKGKAPFLKITTYCNREKTVNGNTGKVTYRVTSEWTMYEFYLPKEIVEGQFEN